MESLQAYGKPVGPAPNSDDSWTLTVWAPYAKKVELHLLEPVDQLFEMQRDAGGYFSVTVPNVAPGTRYLYRLNKSTERPDPASRFQPNGVHEASQLVALTKFEWTDQSWKPPALEQSIFYELHVGTFTEQGTFQAIEDRLAELVDLGITTIELMPVAQFPGSRNWGYDGVYPYAPQNTYGGPLAMQRLINAAHAHGLAVALDVVYNHLGPEGNYLSEYGPYFASRYKTPWGSALNFDAENSVPVRRFFIDNAVYWFREFHVDALRLDAIHAIFDFGAQHFLAEMKDRICEVSKTLGRELLIIAESDLNDSRVLRTHDEGGHGLDGQWSDDFHHSVHTLLTGERNGYYADFGTMEQLATIFERNWLYSGQYSEFRRRRHGNNAADIQSSRFVVCIQNHDQVGNRALGERLSRLVDFESRKLAAGVLLLAPFTPLLFMGEEYGEPSPFQYFTSHGDRDLIEAVRNGRKQEFAEFGWASEVPDPQSEATFENSKLKHLDNREPHRTLRRFYKTLIQLRKDCRLFDDHPRAVHTTNGVLAIETTSDHGPLLILFNFADHTAHWNCLGEQNKLVPLLNSAAPEWSSERTPHASQAPVEDSATMARRSFLVFQKRGGAASRS